MQETKINHKGVEPHFSSLQSLKLLTSIDWTRCYLRFKHVISIMHVYIAYLAVIVAKLYQNGQHALHIIDITHTPFEHHVH